MGAVQPVGCNCCASRCGGQPTVVSIGDDVRAPVQSFPHEEDSPTERWEEDIPEWLAQLSPGLVAEEAALAAKEWVRCAQDLRQRARAFTRNAWQGVQCRVLDQATGKAVLAAYILDEDAASLAVVVEPDGKGQGGSARHEVLLADVRNIWVCADSALARRMHGSIQCSADADLACVVLMDTPTGPLGLVMRSSEAREEFLDCMAVLIASQRYRNEPGLARCDLPGGLPPPEAQLRPVGRSLQSVHLSGPICQWLARIGEDLLMPDVDGAEDEEQILHLPAAGSGLEASTGGTLELPLSGTRAPATTGGLHSCSGRGPASSPVGASGGGAAAATKKAEGAVPPIIAGALPIKGGNGSSVADANAGLRTPRACEQELPAYVPASSPTLSACSGQTPL